MSTLRHFQGNGKVYVGSTTVTVTTLAAEAEEQYTITDANAAVDDVIAVSFADAGMETGLGVVLAWCHTAGAFKIRVSNFNGSAALSGGSRVVYYAIIKTA